MSFDLVKEFNETFRVHMRDSPALRIPEARLRFRLIKEEFKELFDALEDCDIVELADALGDIEYVIIGAAQVFGIADKVQEKAAEFHQEAIDLEIEQNPLLVAEGHKLILSNLADFILREDVDELVEALASVLILIHHAADHYEIPLLNVIRAIHDSNMTKLGDDGKPIFRESDGKVLKGPNYTEPTKDIESLLFG